MRTANGIKIFLGATFILFLSFVDKIIAQQKFEKTVFYNVMSTGNVEAIDKQIDAVQNSELKHKDGYEGALLMKKAGLSGPPAQKLKLFKQGRIKLETAIMDDNENTEFHFLRLAIEEHAPKIVKYHNDIEGDKLIVQKNFKSLSPAVQQAIIDYCKNSKVLKAQEFSTQ